MIGHKNSVDTGNRNGGNGGIGKDVITEDAIRALGELKQSTSPKDMPASSEEEDIPSVVATVDSV